jgi:hypothetical protein
MNLSRLAILAGLVGLMVTATATSAGNGWGTIKGQVVWAGPGDPVRPPLKVDKDQQTCLKHGPLLEETYIVDKATKGVKYVTVWLIPEDAKGAKDYKRPIPLHPTLKDLKEKTVELDQPTCMFEPSIIALREGQTLVCKNSSDIAHNVKIDGGANNPNINPIIPAGKKVEVEGWSATGLGPVPIGCSIHGWMKGQVRVFNHPYYAVTNDKGEFVMKNAPAGKFRIVMYHPTALFINGDRLGSVIDIKPDGVTDLGKIKLTPPKE